MRGWQKRPGCKASKWWSWDRLKPAPARRRPPVSLLEQIEIAANKRDAPYPSLIEMWLSEKVG